MRGKLILAFIAAVTFERMSVTGFNILNDLVGDLGERIWNGKDASPGQVPYQALLIMTSVDNKKAFCGGSLISTSHVLTAAHCCVNVTEMDVFVGLVNTTAFNNSNAVRQTVKSSQLFVHEKYNPQTIANDICVVKLNTPVQTNENISAVLLPSEQNTSPSQYDFESATISGWGQTNDFEGLHSNLQYSTVVLKPHSLCYLFYFFINEVSDSQLCSGKIPWTGPCHGDSGGPLTVKDGSGKPVEIGLVSWGVGSCLSFNPIVFTYVPAYLDWIKEHMM